MGTYITYDNVAARIAWESIHDIFDDDQDGGWKANLDEAIADAESVIEQSISKTYGDAGLAWLQAQGQSCPRSVKRLCLDEFEWRRGHRHPGYTNAALWDKWHDSIKADLKALRLRDVEMGSADEPDAVNEGGFVESGNPDDTTPPTKIFADGMGDFWSNGTGTW